MLSFISRFVRLSNADSGYRACGVSERWPDRINRGCLFAAHTIRRHRSCLHGVNQSERLTYAAVSSGVDYETGGTRVNADINRAVPSGRRADNRLCRLRRVGAPVSQATVDPVVGRLFQSWM